jgi:aspartate aminotransferase
VAAFEGTHEGSINEVASLRIGCAFVSDPVSSKSHALRRATEPLIRFFTGPLYQQNARRPGICDFAFGNPHDPAVEGLSAALRNAATPLDKDWFAYKNSEPESRVLVAAGLRARDGMAYRDEDVFMTNGAFGGLAAALDAIVDPGDEVIFNSPPWFFYEALTLDRGAVPVRVRVDPQTWDLDLAAISRALGPRTRAIIVNSPHNPTGRIYPPELLRALAQLLEDHRNRHGRTVYLLSDEAYHRVVFEGHRFETPAAHYPDTIIVYTYGKTLLAPGERMGYLALPPTMPVATREALRPALFIAQMVTGWAFPNALLQHALPELVPLSIDVSRIQRRRDRLLTALRGFGYSVHEPQGTFYLLPRSPIADDWAFAERLAERDVLCLPGRVAELPGYFRLSLTASDDMVERALPGLEAAIRSA